MAFQDIANVEDYKSYQDRAFRKANRQADKIRGSAIKGTRLEKSWKIELARIDVVKNVLADDLMNVLKSFPTMDDLSEFYKELLKTSVDMGDIKTSLASLGWAAKKINEFHRIYKYKIGGCKHLDKINVYRREFNGRVGSVMKQIRHNLECLIQTRKLMIAFPVIKEKYAKVCICGFPNIGKTTLLSKLSKSKPEIKEYAFTTKTINVGYLEDGDKKIQLLDTPGTLNRLEKMNEIERQAYLAIKYCADVLVYIFDLSEEYPIALQIKLYESIKKYRKPILVYLSKTDILDKDAVDKFKKAHDDIKILSFEELKKSLLEN